MSRSAGTTFARASEIRRRWFVVDADDQPLGRLASRVARVLTGKHKPSWTPFLDCGDHVIVLNAARVRLTGRKEEQKVYYRTSGRPGGLKSRTAAQVRSNHPERLVESAVRGMLPKGSLGRSQFTKLKVYPGGEHPHEAQQPEPLPAHLGPSS
ncbi:MAG: 50S ribosomal protein L13 [Acidobacteria bacterium]|nr:50S ribosomal protein L13 [Acidobacteriota bacterium]MYA45025.1 50S ribosomal protein L13 [Acidobacteriota bacterium]MYI38907.1 50S ribosomal protein L13 [Acidobacteriota bacterium]